MARLVVIGPLKNSKNSLSLSSYNRWTGAKRINYAVNSSLKGDASASAGYFTAASIKGNYYYPGEGVSDHKSKNTKYDI